MSYFSSGGANSINRHSLEQKLRIKHFSEFSNIFNESLIYFLAIHTHVVAFYNAENNFHVEVFIFVLTI